MIQIKFERSLYLLRAMEERHIVAYIENNRKKKVKIAITDIDGILMGFFPYFSQELEWFNFLETPTSIYEKDATSLTPLSRTSFGYSTLQTNLKNDYYKREFEKLFTENQVVT